MPAVELSQRLRLPDAPKMEAYDASNETLATMSATNSGIVEAISLDTPLREATEKYALQFSGVLNVPKAGRWTLRISSDDGSRLYLDNQLLIDNDGNHGMQEKTASVDLSAGPHALTVNYFNSRGGSGLKVEWEGPGMGRSPIEPQYLTHGGSLPAARPPVPSFESTVRQFLPAMISQGSGTVVNFSSGWGRSVSAEVAPYCASKWAIEGLSDALSQELPRGLATAALNPGVINTDMLQSCFGSGADAYASAQEWAVVIW